MRDRLGSENKLKYELHFIKKSFLKNAAFKLEMHKLIGSQITSRLDWIMNNKKCSK